MKTLLALLSILGVTVATVPQAYSEEAPRDGVFIHISHGSDDPHRVLMALNMAGMMAEDHDVLVYFDIKAVGVVLKDSGDITFSHFPSSKTQLAALVNKKATLMVCPRLPQSCRKNQRGCC